LSILVLGLAFFAVFAAGAAGLAFGKPLRIRGYAVRLTFFPGLVLAPVGVLVAWWGFEATRMDDLSAALAFVYLPLGVALFAVGALALAFGVRRA
jgi:hypothetical protein